jgi:hypothetical protein
MTLKPLPRPQGGPDTRRWHRVTDEAAAAFLVQDANRRFLRPFLEKATSVSEAAEELGETVESVYYRVRRMLELGIVEVTREEPRAGRPVKYYRSVGQGLFVPFAVTGAATIEEITMASNAQIDERFVRGQITAMREAFEDHGVWGYRLFRDAAGGVHFDYAPHDAPDDFDLMEAVLAPTAPPVVSAWIGMPLQREDAKALQEELVELAARYRAKASSEGANVRYYLLRVALAPLLDSDE